MRRILEVVALLLLLFLFAVTAYAVAGPDPLPAKIPTHFNAAGQPDAWGTPAMLWMLPAIAAVVYLLMSLAARNPAAFHFPMRVRPPARRRLEAIALAMISWIKVEVVCLMAWIQYETVAFARRGQGTLAPMFLPIVLGAVFATIAVHIGAMRRVARG